MFLLHCGHCVPPLSSIAHCANPFVLRGYGSGDYDLGIMAMSGRTLTFLFTDIVGSTTLWENCPEAMGEVVPMHDRIITGAVEARGGKVFKTVGDAVCAVFDDASTAVGAAVDAQGALAAHDWPEATGPVAVRMGVHTGVAQPHGDSDFLGPTLNRVARLVDAGHGGQILVSESAQSLIEDLCVDLGRHQLKGLARSEQIYQIDYEGGPSAFPALRTSLAAAAGNLPLDLEPMFGRSTEVESVIHAMEGRRLVTLTGNGGVGKTRLALGAASEFGEQSAKHGTWLVPLAPLAADADIYATVASTLSIQIEGDRSLSDSVMAALATRESLLVLDNAEHVLESTRDFAASVVASCPSIRLLVTSREPLGVRGEQVVRVPPLAVRNADGGEPGPGPAVQLLQHRIALDGIAIDSSTASIEALERLAGQLDGLPLALELAAARCTVLGVDGLIARLDRQLDVLSDRSSPEPRHATLHATIDWSYALLDESEREIFRRFSVFANGCTLDAVEAVCGRSDGSGAGRGDLVLDAVEHLVAASMVNVEIDEAGRTRFSMLEGLRQYAQLQLDANNETAAASEAHATYYRALAERIAEGVRGSDIEAVRAVEVEVDNFRAAYNWGLITDNPELYVEIPAVFGFFYYEVRDDEMARWLSAALERESASASPLFPTALSIAAGTAQIRGDVVRRDDYLAQLTSLAQTQELSFDARSVFLVREFYEGQVSLDGLEAELESSPYDPHDECQRRLILSLAYLYQSGDRDQAIREATRMLELADGHGLTPLRAWALYTLAEACQPTEPERARVMLDEAVVISQDWGLALVNGVSRVSLVTTNMQLGRTSEAARILSDLINEWHLQGNWQHQWVALRNAVELLADVGQTEAAANLLRSIESSPSSGDVFGAQGDRLEALAATFDARLVADPLSDDQIVGLAIEALDEAALESAVQPSS